MCRSKGIGWLSIFTGGLVSLMVSVGVSVAQSPHSAVRISSHGASGTVVWTSNGKSYILSCAHMFEKSADYTKRIRLTSLLPKGMPERKGVVRIVAVSPEIDLSLLEIDMGPLYVTPVLPSNALISRSAQSVGYDNMELPMKREPTKVLRVTEGTIWTQQKPWHGRSGGGLIGSDGYLFGVVQGYTGSTRRYDPRGNGVYVGHVAITSFLARHAPWLTGRRSQPQRYQEPFVDRSPLSRPQGFQIEQQCPT